MNEYNIIESVVPGSIAEEAGFENGDVLIKINGHDINDILEYKYLEANEFLELEVLTKDGETVVLNIEKDQYEGLGLNFKYPLMSKPRSCRNKCIFCFIDQLPQGMRETLYFKDDDSRLSFLQGNYVTLTNLSDEEINRIGEMRISPVNISVHATEPELRCMMMNNKNAGNILEIMKKWQSCGIVMNCQIVLCKNINDGGHLFKSLDDLTSMYPSVNSISVVPCGLSDHRQNLFKIEPFSKKDAEEIVKSVSLYQKKMLCKHGSRIVFLSDEFYLTAGIPLPEFEHYEDFPQIENGVGLLASFKDEFDFALDNLDNDNRPASERHVSVITGKAAYSFIKELAERAESQIKNLKIDVYKIENTVFGKNITVTGLLCGSDIVSQLKNKVLGSELLISKSMLRSGEDVLLDDMRVSDIAKALNITVTPTETDGEAFLYALLGLDTSTITSNMQNPYELSDI